LRREAYQFDFKAVLTTAAGYRLAAASSRSCESVFG
jgi:hypothetical protein